MNQWIELIQKKLNHWWVVSVKMLPNVFIAVIAFILSILISRWIKKMIFRMIIRISGKPSVSGLFANIAATVIVIIGLSIALDVLHLDKAVSSILAGAGILGLVLGFAFQDLSSNFISGLFIAFKKPFEVGHIVETNGYTGIIEDIQIRTTTIRTFQGLHVMIPNREIFQKPMINYSRTAERRIELEFIVDAKADLKAIENAIVDVAAKMCYLHKEKKPEIFFTAFTGTTVKVAVWLWIYNNEAPGYHAALHELIGSIVAGLKRAGIVEEVKRETSDVKREK